MPGTSHERHTVFISYSHADRRHLDQLLLHLAPLRRDRKIEVWADTMLKAGDDWREEIARGIASARVAIVLVSAAFRASKFIAENELPPLLMAAKKDGLLILPVIVGHCDFNGSELAHVQAVNAPSKPLAAMTRAQRDVIWMQVARRVKDAFPSTCSPKRTERMGDSETSGLPVPSTSQPAENVDELIKQGAVLVAQDKNADAIPFFECATQLNPRSHIAWGSLGYLYNVIGRWQDALAACDRALALDGKQAAVWANKGIALDDLGSHEEALTSFDRSLVLDPKSAVTWTNKGIVLNAMGRYRDALAAYERALAFDADDPRAWNNKSVTFIALNRYRDAVTAAIRAIELRPEYVLAWYNKAVALRELGRDAEADEAERKARELGWRTK